MRQLVLCGLMLSLWVFGAKNERDWKIGKVVDSAVSSREYTRGAITTATTAGTVSPDYGAGSTVHGTTTATTTVRHVEVDTNNLAVVGAEYIYTVQDSTGTAAAGCLGRRWRTESTVADSLWATKSNTHRTSVDSYVLGADGKECRLDIVRQEERQ